MARLSCTRNIVAIFFVLLEHNSRVSAQNGFQSGSRMRMTSVGHGYFNLLTSVLHAHDSGTSVLDYTRIQNKIVGLISKSYIDHVDYICDINNSKVEYREKKNLVNDMTKGGRKQLTEIVNLTKGFYNKHLNTLLLAYKFKFFTLFPLLMAAMLLIVKTSGLAGFFFAMFVASMALGSMHHH